MYILINGEFHLSDEQLFGHTFTEQYLFCETVRAVRNELPFFSDHINLILLKFRILNVFTPAFMKDNARELKRQIDRTLVKNKLYRSTIVEIHFFQEGESISYMIVPRNLDTFEYSFNQKGLLTDIFDKVPKAATNLSNLSLGSEMYWKIARQHIEIFSIDDYILINTEGNIVECPEKNIYLIKDNMLITPAVEAGTYVDVSRRVILSLAQQRGYEVQELQEISIDTLYEATEVFVANSLIGIQWLLGFREKRYYNTQTRQLFDQLNNWIKSQRN